MTASNDIHMLICVGKDFNMKDPPPPLAGSVAESQNGSIIEENEESRGQDDVWNSLKDLAG